MDVDYLHHFFESSVKDFGQSKALEDAEQTLTYNQLEELSNKIAHFLVEVGCKANERVVVFTEKNLFAYAGVLAALKAGSCFVPLSDSMPQQRVRDLVVDTSPKCIISDKSTIAFTMQTLLELNKEIPVLCLDDAASHGNYFNRSDIEQWDGRVGPKISLSPEDLAYIIFTSGSTGKPKGVMAKHANISFFLNTCKKIFNWGEGLRFAHQSELTFDPSLFDLFHCWSSGGVLIPMNKRRYRIDPAAFIEECKINVWFCVPSVLRAVLKSPRMGTSSLSSLKQLILTGEMLPANLVNQWKKVYPDCQVYNFYGATESVIITHYYRVDGELDETRPTPVGKPVPGMHVALLQDGNLDPARSEGECVIYGPQVSPGYWNNQAETRSRFVKNLYNEDYPQTMYHMGDILKIREDGNFEYLGRIDRQVKISGYRIELQEVEIHIMQIDSVEEVAVLPIFYENQYQMIAFIYSLHPTNENEIRLLLKSKIPFYMIPLHIIVKREPLPKNQNNKVDYLQLKNSVREIWETI